MIFFEKGSIQYCLYHRNREWLVLETDTKDRCHCNSQTKWRSSFFPFAFKRGEKFLCRRDLPFLLCRHLLSSTRWILSKPFVEGVPEGFRAFSLEPKNLSVSYRASCLVSAVQMQKCFLLFAWFCKTGIKNGILIYSQVCTKCHDRVILTIIRIRLQYRTNLLSQTPPLLIIWTHLLC